MSAQQSVNPGTGEGVRPSSGPLPKEAASPTRQSARRFRLGMAGRAATLLAAGPLTVIVFASLGLNLANNGFPLGWHFDEPKKVRFVRTFDQDFHHPVLMLELVRAANAVIKLQDDLQIAVLGRSIMALAGTLIVVLMYFLARPHVGHWGAALTAALTAVMPTIVVHSHYFKEDILLVATGTLALLLMGYYLRRPSFAMAWFAGVALGLALASHYKAFLLPTALVFYLLLAEPRRVVQHLLPLVLMATSSAIVFLAVNSVILEDPQTFWAGINHERRHAVVGHWVPIYWYHFGLTYHLYYSLLGSMTLPVAAFSLLATAWYTWGWMKLMPVERLLVVFAVLSYLVPEISPSKPPPDDCRYILPVVPILCYFSAKWLVAGFRHFRAVGARIAVAGAVAAMLVVALVDSVQLVRYLEDDTRARAKAWVERQGHVALYEVFAETHIRPVWGYALDVERYREAGYTHFVSSSFAYDQYFLGAALPHQPQRVYQRHEGYVRLFELPYVEIRPRWRSFAFSNPVIRIVELRHDSKRSIE